jgi:hypothetical protein
VRTSMFVLLIGLSVAFCQENRQASRAENVVRGALTQPEKGVYLWTSTDEKQLSRLGDASAVQVSTLIDGKDIGKNEMRQILRIILASFQNPRQIEAESDRDPRAASILIERLQRMPASSGLTEEFAGTEQVLAAARKANAH